MAQNGSGKKNITPAAAGLAGAVVGAAVGAAAVALADKDNRKKVQQTVEEIKKMGEKQFSKIQHHTKKAANETKELAEDVKDAANDMVDDQQSSKKSS